MAILETKALVEEGIANAYASAGNKGATIPAQKNIKNLAETIESIQGGGGIDSVQTVTDYPATEVKNTLYVRSLTPAQPYDAIEMKYNEKVIWEKEHFEPTEGLVYTYREDTDDYMVGGIQTGSHIAGMEINIPEYYDDGIHGQKRVTTIGDSAFFNKKILSINAPFVLELKESALQCGGYSANSLQKVNLNNCRKFGRSSMSGLSIPFDFSNAEEIETLAFYDYGGGTFNFGDKLSSLSISAFTSSGGTLPLVTLSLDAANQTYKLENGCIYRKSDGEVIFVDVANASSFKFPDECKKMSEGNVNRSLLNVFRYNQLKTIDFNKITKCDGYSISSSSTFMDIMKQGRVESVKIGNMTTCLTKTKIKKIILNNECSITNAFGSNIANYSSYYHENKFPNLTKIEIESGNAKFAVGEDIKLYSKDYTTLYFYPSTLSEFSIDNRTTTINGVSIGGNNNLTSITYPESVIKIYDVGAGCKNVNSITILGTNYTLSALNSAIEYFNGSSEILDFSKCSLLISSFLADLKNKSNIKKIILPNQFDISNYSSLGYGENCVLEFKYDEIVNQACNLYYLFDKTKILSAHPNSNYTTAYEGRILYGQNLTSLAFLASKLAESLDLLELPTSINRIEREAKNYMMSVKKMIVNSKIEYMNRGAFDCVTNIVRFNTTSEQLPVISNGDYLSTSSTLKVHIPFDDISAWWVLTNIYNWRDKFVGYKTYATGDTFPTTIVLANTTYNLTWYSDEALTTEAGATATADSEYYCTLQQA